MGNRDDRAVGIGLFIALFGGICAAVGALLVFHFQTVREWWALLIVAMASTFATPAALLDAEVSVFGAFLAVSGLPLLLAGMIITRKALVGKSSAQVPKSPATHQQAGIGSG